MVNADFFIFLNHQTHGKEENPYDDAEAFSDFSR
jgi:hypothetical protein